MPARKAIEMGRGTILVSLPKEWVKRNGIKKGMDVSVEELPSGKIIVRPFESREEEQKQIVIEYGREAFGQVANDVTGAYLLGYDVSRVAGNKVISREDREIIKDTL